MERIKVPIILLLFWVSVSGMTAPYWFIPKMPGVIGLVIGSMAWILLGILIGSEYQKEKLSQKSEKERGKTSSSRISR